MLRHLYIAGHSPQSRKLLRVDIALTNNAASAGSAAVKHFIYLYREKS
jgi:hypothetical protein